MAPVGQAPAGQLPPQAVIYRDTCCHRNHPAGAPLAHLSCGHASTGWGEAPLALRPHQTIKAEWPWCTPPVRQPRPRMLQLGADREEMASWVTCPLVGSPIIRSRMITSAPGSRPSRVAMS